MKSYGEIKNLPFKELKGISSKTIEIHWGKLYQGYVKKWQEIQEKLKTVDLSGANATFSELRELKVEQTFAANAVLLHEAYFDILGGDGKPRGEIVEAIKKDYDSLESWMEHFRALGLASRGWVILAFDFNEGVLRNYIADSHNSYGIWGAAPLAVLDMYEHAYFIDFGSDKKSYIEVFFQNLNWEAINKKFQRVQKR
ncbi:MAG: superoxide dismutase [Candidatus Nealsonbacteria bacterium]|nr:superoxide dismutase [Candidatus Nealsonbacteria bacterium]